MVNQGKKLYCTLIDFTKAIYYKVRDNLWYKLIKLGLMGTIMNIIKSMYSCVKSRVQYENKLSEKFTCMLGIRQGECLSPFLFFNVFERLEEDFAVQGIEDIDAGMIKFYFMRMILLYFHTVLKGCKMCLIIWLLVKKWKLKVNTSQRKVMVFRKGGFLPRNLEYLFDNERLEIVNKFTHLGVV